MKIIVLKLQLFILTPCFHYSTALKKSRGIKRFESEFSDSIVFKHKALTYNGGLV